MKTKYVVGQKDISIGNNFEEVIDFVRKLNPYSFYTIEMQDIENNLIEEFCGELLGKEIVFGIRNHKNNISNLVIIQKI